MPYVVFAISAVFLASAAAMHLPDRAEGMSFQQAQQLELIRQVSQEPRANILTTSETQLVRTSETQRWVF